MPELMELIPDGATFQQIVQKIEEKGLEKGLEIGMEKARTEFALKLLKRQVLPFSVDDIADLTGLTKKSVLDLQRTLDSQPILPTENIFLF